MKLQVLHSKHSKLPKVSLIMPKMIPVLIHERVLQSIDGVIYSTFKITLLHPHLPETGELCRNNRQNKRAERFCEIVIIKQLNR